MHSILSIYQQVIVDKSTQKQAKNKQKRATPFYGIWNMDNG